MDKSLVVIPTVRNVNVISDYVNNAEQSSYGKDDIFLLIVTEDHIDKSAYKSKLKELGVDGQVFGQSDRDKLMADNGIGKYADLIPKRSHAETSFGLVYLLLHPEYKYCFFIDDDTLPTEGTNYFGAHMANLNFRGSIESVSSDKNWVNVLYQTHKKHKLYPRGYPYSKMGEVLSKQKVKIAKNDRVYLSQGLWTNVPDLDAIRILMDGDLDGQAKTRLSADNFTKNFVAANGNFITICSMNLAFRREIIPAFYQMPMDDNPYHIGRFDDIWSGVVAKSAVDQVGGYIINGFPLCIHNKAPRSTFKDVSLEAPGYESNEYFAEAVKSARHTTTSDILEISEDITKELIANGRTPFIKYCGEHMARWLSMCRKVGSV